MSHADRKPCDALVDDWQYGGVHAPMLRMSSPGTKPCSRRGVEKVGPFVFCTVHARMAREGLIKETGRVIPRSQINDIRKYPERFPNGMYQWAQATKGERA